MPFRRNILQYLVIPQDAGPGQSRMVITTQLPPPLDTYIVQPHGKPYTAGIIWYNDNLLGIDTAFTYLCNVKSDSGAIWQAGQVFSGAVVEDDDGTVQGIELAAFGAGVTTDHKIRADSLKIDQDNPSATLFIQADGQLHIIANDGFDTQVTGQMTIDVAGAGNDLVITVIDDVNISAGDVLTVSGTTIANFAASTVSGTANILAGGSSIVVSPSGVAIAAPGSGDDITLTANDDINLDAGGEIQVQATRAYLLTQIQTNNANADLTLTTSAQTVSNCSITLPTVTANARYEAEITCDIDMTAVGGASGIGDLDVDGTIQAASAIFECAATTDRATVSQHYSGTLATAGNHTFILKGRKDVASGTIVMHQPHSTLRVKIFESGG